MGYVGVPVAALFADVPGFQVTGLQRRSKRSGWKIEALNQGVNPIGGVEPGLGELVRRVVEKGSLRATSDPECLGQADAVLVTVQTPVDENHQPLYDSLLEALHEVGRRMRPGALVSLESTVAPGTTMHVAKPILERESGLRAGEGFNLVFSYERVMVGRLLHNLTQLDRVVGGVTPQCAGRGVELYRHIVQAGLHPTDATTAEVAKVVENTYRDVNIGFANEVALICESLGVDVWEVRELVNSLPNIPGDPDKNPYRNMHRPGAGVGGHCLPKDPWLLKHGLDTYGALPVEPAIIVASRMVNDYMPSHMGALLWDALDERGLDPGDARVAILGFAFLGNSDDPRNTPSIPLFRQLEGVVGEVVIHDPYVEEYEGYPLTGDLEGALAGRDAAVLVTGHDEYRGLTLERLKELLRTPILVDGRNIWDRKKALRMGFTFRGVGQPRGGRRGLPGFSPGGFQGPPGAFH